MTYNSVVGEISFGPTPRLVYLFVAQVFESASQREESDMSRFLRATLAWAVIAPTASLGSYIGSVVGVGPGGVETPSLTVNPGESFSAVVVLDGDLGTQSDSAIFRLVFSVEGVAIASGWSNWTSPYLTGGLDDFSSPTSGAAGLITASSYADPLDVGATDVYFENLTKSAGAFFSTGTLISLSFTVPAALESIGSFTISFVPDTFTNGASFVDATAGAALTVNVLPAPGVSHCGVLAWAASRRRRARSTQSRGA